MHEVKFLFDNQLIAELESLIKEAKNKLLLVSPFIDIDSRIKDALNEKKLKPDFELKVLFGKNENNLYKSIKKDSLNFLKQFPNVEIRYEERLHAKFYLNDFDYIMTSMNLYDYSLANNIEVGIKGQHSPRGVLGKMVDSTDNLVAQGMGKVTNELLGFKKDEINPIQKFEMIFNNAEIKFKSEPILEDKNGLISVFSKNKLKGISIVIDKLDDSQSLDAIKSNPPNSSESIDDYINNSKCISASQVAKLYSVSIKDVTDLMEINGIISKDRITELGLRKGVQMKNYMGRDYIAYPENLELFVGLKK